MKTTLITKQDIRELVERIGLDAWLDRLLADLRAAFARHTEDGSETPARAGFSYQSPVPGLVEWMPCRDHRGRASVKIVAYHPRNPERSRLPTILSTIGLYDTETGHLLALVDGTLLTALRTGAASALASEVLASPQSEVLGLIGCGAQSVTQLHALSRVFRLREVLLHDVDPRSVETFEKRIQPLGLQHLRVHASTAREILERADILCTATSVGIGAGPIIPHGSHRPHLHINAVGSDFPGKIELPRTLLEEAFVCPDFLEQAIVEGECQQLTREKIGPSIDRVVRDAALYTERRKTLTVFDSTGWALEDHVAVITLLELASRCEVGTRVEIESTSMDPKSPYEFLTRPAGVMPSVPLAPSERT